MEEEKLAEYIDQQRWLINNGLIPDSVKNQLFFYGSVVHQDVQAVEVDIDVEHKKVSYVVYLGKKTLKKIDTYKKLSTATSLIGMWRFKRFLQKEGSLDFQSMLNSFVTEFCGPQWSAKCTVVNFDVYIDSIGDNGGAKENSQQPNKLPD